MQNKRFFLTGILIAVITSMVFTSNRVANIVVAQETTTNATTSTTTMEEPNNIAEGSARYNSKGLFYNPPFK